MSEKALVALPVKKKKEGKRTSSRSSEQDFHSERVEFRPGRPTKYKKKYCQDVIDFMSKGYSLEAFAGSIGTHKDTIYEWQKKHTEFSDAVKIAKDQCRIQWEKQGMNGLWGGHKFNPTVWIFNMKNRFRDEWRDSHDVTSDGERLDSLSAIFGRFREEADRKMSK